MHIKDRGTLALGVVATFSTRELPHELIQRPRRIRDQTPLEGWANGVCLSSLKHSLYGLDTTSWGGGLCHRCVCLQPPFPSPTGGMCRARTLERVNKEIKRRTNVVGIFPNEAGVLRLAGSTAAAALPAPV